jgi:outer membrane protein TolC
MKLLLTIASIFIIQLSFAQDGIPADSLQYNPFVDSIGEKLVKLALENSRVSAMDNAASSTEYEYKRTKTTWLNNIAVTGNLNEFSLTGSGQSNDPLRQSTQYPRYNVGVVLPLGLFINNGKATKAAYHRYEASVDQLKIEQQNIRREVLTLYEDYVLNKQLLGLQQSLIQDTRVLLSQQEEKFGDGKITLEEYVGTNRQFTNEKVKLAAIIHDLKVNVAGLEALIGMNIEVALDQFKRGAPSGRSTPATK